MRILLLVLATGPVALQTHAQTLWVDGATNLYYVADGTTNRIVLSLSDIIPTNPVVRECEAYVPSTNSTFDVDVTRPTQEELGYTVGCAEVQTRAKFLLWLLRHHHSNGTHRADFLTLGNIADGLITSNKLDAATQLVLSNAAALATQLSQRRITGAKTYVDGIETALPAVWLSTTVTNILAPFGTLIVPTNTFARVIVQGEVELTRITINNFTFPGVTLTIGTNTVSYGPWNLPVLPGVGHDGNAHRKYVRVTLYLVGGQLEALPISVTASSDRVSPNDKTTASLRFLRIFGVY